MPRKKKVTKYYLLKTPSGTAPKVYSESAMQRVDYEIRERISNDYNQRVALLGYLSSLDSYEFRYLDEEKPDTVAEFRELFPTIPLMSETVKELYEDYVVNGVHIKGNYMQWVWEEVEFVEE